MANKQDVDLKFSIIDGVTKFITDLKVAIKGVGTSFTELNQLSELVGKGFDKIAAAAGKIGDAVAGAAAFEEALARVGARTDATIDQQVALQQAVENAVSATTFSVTEAADALAALAEDGFSAKEAADQLGNTLIFANAAAIGAAEATGLLGTVLDKFAASPDVIGDIADALTATAAEAGASTKAIAEGLAGVGTAAKAANVSIADSVAVLGTLAVEGVESSAAVGRLNKIFQDFAEPASKFSVAIKEAGLGGLEFVDVVAALQKDSAAASDVLATLGDKPREAMRLLLQEGGSDLESFTAIIDKSGGAAQAAADKLNNTFNGALTKLTNQLELARTKLLLPILSPLTEQFEKFGARVSAFVETEQFQRITEQVTAFTEKAITAFGDFVESIDFDKTVASVELFATNVNNAFNGIVAVVKFFAAAVNTALDLAQIGFGEVVSALTGTLATLFEAFGVFSESAALIGNEFRAMQETAKELSEGSLKDLEDRFGATTKKTEELKAGIEAAAIAARQSKGDFSDLKNALPQADILSIANNFGLLADKLGNDVPKAAKETKKGILELNTEFDAAVIELRRAQKAYEEVFASGADGAAEAFKAVQKAGSEVARLRKELDTTKISAEELQAAFKDVGLKSQKDLIAEAEKARKAFELIADAVRDGGAAQADVARAFEVYASRLRETADGADEATKKQIAQQIELAGTTAGVSRELINAQTAGLGLGDAIQKSGDKAEKALEGIQKSATKTADTLAEAQKATDSYATANNSMAAAVDGAGGAMDALAQVTVGYLGTVKDGALILENNIDANGRMASALRDQFEATNPLARAKRLQEEAESALNAQREKSEKLIAAEIAQLEAQDPKIREENALRAQLAARFGENADGLDRLIALRQKEREEREASLAVGQQELAQNQQLVATQPKPGNTNNVTINVNITGSQDSQAYWRRIVSEFILPELKRLERLEQ